MSLLETASESIASSTDETGRPDPGLTANLYCEGRLDEALHRCMAVFWQSFHQHERPEKSYLWFMRYRKCGEHLKLRFHGPEEQLEEMRRLLEVSAMSFFAGLEPKQGADRPPDQRGVLPIDVEDQATELYPDCSLLWTTYQRSPVSLGGKPFLDHDIYNALMTRCLGDSAEIVLGALVPDEEGQVPHQKRQTLLIKVLIPNFTALAFTRKQCGVYTAYHRDWLLRYMLRDSVNRVEKARELLERFERRFLKIRPSLSSVERALENACREDGSSQEEVSSDAGTPLASLVEYLGAFQDQEGYQSDPFTADLSYPAVFKVFHGTANQIGLRMLDEAFTHHLLSRLSDPETADHEVAFIPQ